jgi:hypothetical protein
LTEELLGIYPRYELSGWAELSQASVYLAADKWRPQILECPLEWRLGVHTCGEFYIVLPSTWGSRAPLSSQTDEVNRWIFLLKAVENAMPCALCRDTTRSGSPRTRLQFTALRGVPLRERARKWLYDLHENVNAGGRLYRALLSEQLPEMYGSLKGYQEAVDKFIAFTKDSIQYGHVKADGLWQFRNNLHYLRKIAHMI